MRMKTYKFLFLATVFYTDIGFAGLVEDLEGEVLHIRLHFLIIEFTTDQSFGVENTETKVSTINDYNMDKIETDVL
jgi:hypothetical protein